MQTKEFARRVQASFDAAFGSGTSVVKVLGPSPDDVKATAFEVLVRPPFGASFAIPNAQLKSIPEIDESAGSIAALSYQLSRDMSESVQQFLTALVIADPSVFMPDRLEPTFDEIIEASNREVAAEGVFYPCKPDIFDATYDTGEVSEDESDVEELRALLTQALEERDEARATLSALQSEKEVSE